VFGWAFDAQLRFGAEKNGEKITLACSHEENDEAKAD
jgi:hypothetical protein